MRQNYHPITKALHWLIALHMIGLIALGWWMIDLNFYSTWYYTAPYLHKAFGVVVFALGLILLGWRKLSSKPQAMKSHSRFEVVASKAAHIILLTAVIVIPISGYVFTTYSGESVDVFGVFSLPAAFQVSEAVRDIAIDFHIYASYGLIAVILAHAGGALKHHFVDRDETLRRMTF